MTPQSPDHRDPARALERLRRLLAVCRTGLNHDLGNQLVAMQGLLQLLHAEETARLSPAGQDYVRRLVGVVQRTQALARSLRDFSRLGDIPPAEVVALPELVEEVTTDLQPPPACECDWEAPRVLAPRPLVQQALATAFRLLGESASEAQLWRLCSRPSGDDIELTVEGPLPPDTSRPDSANPALPAAWHERLECILIRELADAWGGTASWRASAGGAALVLTLPAPP